MPLAIRLEITELYHEFGGIDLLINLTHISYKTIKNWHELYLKDPEFLTKKTHKLHNRQPMKDSDGRKKPAPRAPRTNHHKGMTTFEEMKHMYPSNIQNEILRIKALMEESIVADGTVSMDIKR